MIGGGLLDVTKTMFFMSLPAVNSSSPAWNKRRQLTPRVLALALLQMLVSCPGISAFLGDVRTSPQISSLISPTKHWPCRRRDGQSLSSLWPMHQNRITPCSLFPPALSSLSSSSSWNNQLYSTISDNEAWRLASLNELGSRAGTVTPAMDFTHQTHVQTSTNGETSDRDDDHVRNAVHPPDSFGSVAPTLTESPISTVSSTAQLYRGGVNQLTSEDDYRAFIQSNPHSLVVIKFYAAYCHACRALEPRFIEVMNDPQLKNLPVVWAEFQASRHTKELFRRLGVLTLPTIHFYDGSMLDDGNTNDVSPSNDVLQQLGLSSNLIENFPCPPAKVKLLKKKLARFLNQRVDPATLQLKKVQSSAEGIEKQHGQVDAALTLWASPKPASDTDADSINRDSESQFPSSGLTASTAFQPSSGDAPRQKRKIVIDNELITDDHIEYLRYGMPFFKDLTDDEFDTLLQKARLLTFNAGDVICKQGMPGTTFYVLKRGLVEMSIKSRFEDPIRTPPNYLGVVVGELRRGDYFGERALSTGQPLAASFRVVEKVRVFAFDAIDIPESSILSKQRRATREMIQQLDQRYILPADYKPVVSYNQYMMNEADDWILELLVRFKQIRQAAKCFNYIMMTEPKWNDPGEIARRTLLIQKLSGAQEKEFQEVFDMVDVKKSGMISLLEMRKFMETARQQKTDQELLEMINRANPAYARSASSTDHAIITRSEFMGVMAEAEFYNLLTETFQELDRDNTGYVRAGDLDMVLGGVQDLITDKKKISIINVEDADMLVDYEQFSKMLLGAAL